MENEPSFSGCLGNLSFVDELYHKYSQDPESVDPTWKYFFAGMDFAGSGAQKTKEDGRILELIDAYRRYGHLQARCNPLEEERQPVPELDLQRFGFRSEDLSKIFPTRGLLSESQAPLSAILSALQSIYCQNIGLEYMGCGLSLEQWILSQVEPRFSFSVNKEEKRKILEDLTRAELFEAFIHTKYVGQVRFSLEGGETLIPLLSALFDELAEAGGEEAMIGMAHRGRLNVLANILQKSQSQIFREFEGHVLEGEEGSGDLNYHKGGHCRIKTLSGKSMELVLAANPSHLESVDPIVEGYSRAKQDLKQGESTQVIPVLIHGDASLAGQGVVYETLQLSKLKGYATGGTIHIVVNNHIGYTTAPSDSRSTRYCTDIAKSFGSPVFHVNAENPEECILMARLAAKIRQKFQCDVFIDLNCYRKYGHNEGDEPTFTQPREYGKIKKRPSIRTLYLERLLQEGVVTQLEVLEREALFKAELQESFSAKPPAPREISPFLESSVRVEADVPQWTAKMLRELGKTLCTIPEGFHLHAKLQKLQAERLAMFEGRFDWGMAEALAYGSLVSEGIHVRLSGQDAGRGTFSHRHAVWVDQENGKKYLPLSHVKQGQTPFSVYDSPLSEFAVLGFDLGYSMAAPHSLAIWEAQYGDFFNGAQIIIDQYLASSEQKWSSRFNLTLLLPHGYEGKGPEHSSARIERFLQLCAEGNMIVVNCSTPAQFYHVLRRQAHLKTKKPLVVFTPKALLRHPQCQSELSEFSEKGFSSVLDDPKPPLSVRKVLFCSGKVFYDLLQEREKRADSTSCIIRIEQLYPFPMKEIKEIVKRYAGAAEYCWVQEEHQNMGAWSYIAPLLSQELGEGRLRYVGRDPSASPSAGSYTLHKKQYEKFMEAAFTGETICK